MQSKPCTFFNYKAQNTIQQSIISKDEFLRFALLGPQKNAFEFLDTYHTAGGTVDHPQLGNLLYLASEIEQIFRQKSGEPNLVALMIRCLYCAQVEDHESETAATPCFRP